MELIYWNILMLLKIKFTLYRIAINKIKFHTGRSTFLLIFKTYIPNLKIKNEILIRNINKKS